MQVTVLTCILTRRKTQSRAVLEATRCVDSRCFPSVPPDRKMPHSHPASPASPQSPRREEPFSPRSPQSLSLGEVFESQYPNTVTADSTEPAHPTTLHLKPVTWQSLAELHLPCSETFEIIDGLLVWIPMANGTAKHQRIAEALVSLFLSLYTWNAVYAADIEVESATDASDSINTRIPDVSLTRRQPGSPTESSSSQETPRKLVRFKKTKPPYAVIEVTSPGTRSTDLTVKWIQYYKTGIKFYYIIDLYGFETSGVAKVIVGSKERRDGWTRCHNGDPDGAGSSSGTSTQSRSGSYYKKVYTGDNLVNVGVFEQTPLTPSELVSSTVLNRKVERIRQERENKYRQNQELSQQLHNKDQQLQNKDGQIEELFRQNAELKAKLSRAQGSSSKSQPGKTRMKQKHQPSSSSRRQSNESQSASPTNSPEKKRHKQRERD